jgi:hypothetical protein
MVKQARFGQPAVYNASAITLTDGDSAAGEDITNDVQKVEQRFTSAAISTATTTTS